MNILEILTLNRHGDFEEVMFSSLLSYLLNPTNDHGLRSIFLEKLVKETFPEAGTAMREKVIVTPEHPLGKNHVDIYIEMGKKVLAIEVKIWDRSARNLSKAGTPQLKRYCDYLWEKHAPDDWRFVYLIPTFDSPKCLSEFETAYGNEYRDNLKLMAWNPPDEESSTVGRSCRDALVEKSVAEMISEMLGNREIKRVSTPLNTLWLLDSLQEFIPHLKQDVPDATRFPTVADLRKNRDTWRILDGFLSAAKRWPSGINTTVGVPYGTGENKSPLHDNSLYRIRITKDFYTSEDDKARNLPSDRVELELWPDVYAAAKQDLIDWIATKHLGSKVTIGDGRHLDGDKKTPVKLVGIDRTASLSETDISDFNSIMRIGFDRVRRKSAG